jgi:hypothetical protein
MFWLAARSCLLPDLSCQIFPAKPFIAGYCTPVWRGQRGVAQITAAIAAC